MLVIFGGDGAPYRTANAFTQIIVSHLTRFIKYLKTKISYFLHELN